MFVLLLLLLNFVCELGHLQCRLLLLFCQKTGGISGSAVGSGTCSGGTQSDPAVIPHSADAACDSTASARRRHPASLG